MIVLAGKNNVAVASLNYLINDLNVKQENIFVVCNKSENGRDGWQLSLRKRAKELGIVEITLEESENCADFFISLEFDQIIRPERFKTDKLFNIHFSLLPKYKGMYTSIWPILHGDIESGTTLHLIDAGIDTGDIVDQDTFVLTENDCSKDLYLKLIDSGIRIFKKNIRHILLGSYKKISQKFQYSSYFSKESICFSDIRIDLNKTAWEIGRQIRAFSFRDYQLPKVHGNIVVNFEILDSRSLIRSGEIIEERDASICISTADYDMVLYSDKLDKTFSLMKNEYGNNIENLIKNIINIDDRNKESWTLLMVAAYNGNLSLVEKLIDLNANINAENFKGTSVLMYAKDNALKSNNNELFKYLLEKKADLEHRDLLGKSIREYVTNEQYNFLLH
jgi:methionyl-tRNA formyltransferase